MERLANNYPQAKGLTLRALKQAARELLLAQSSDWAFMINAGTMAEYATERTKRHISRLARLAQDVESDSIDQVWLSKLETRDNIFPGIDYRFFCGSSRL
jgi:1,4-alpha-glucan branching enzyme